jgi:hypothetical protein
MVACSTEAGAGEDEGLDLSTTTAPGTTDMNSGPNGDATAEGETTAGDGDASTEPTAGEGDGDGDGDGSTEQPLPCEGADPGLNILPDDWDGSSAWMQPGDPVLHFSAVDHNGEVFNLCDYAGTPTLVVTSGVWCVPCQAFSSAVAGQADQFGVPAGVLENINDGTVKLLEVLVDGAVMGTDATEQEAYEWHEAYPHDLVSVTLDDYVGASGWDHNGRMNVTLFTGGIPSFGMISPDFVWETAATNGGGKANAALAAASAY